MKCPCCGSPIEISLSVVGPPDNDVWQTIWPKGKSVNSRKHRNGGLDQAIELLTTKGPDHNHIERYPQGKPTSHLPEREHDLRPYTKVDRAKAAELAAMAERKARLENRALRGQGVNRPFKDASARQLNNIINGVE